MKKYTLMIALSLLFVGCSGNITPTPPDATKYIIDDFLKQIKQTNPPAHSSFQIAINSKFEYELDKKLRTEGYALDPSATPIHIYIDPIYKNLFRATYNMEKALMSRAYAYDNNRTSSVSSWTILKGNDR